MPKTKHQAPSTKHRRLAIKLYKQGLDHRTIARQIGITYADAESIIRHLRPSTDRSPEAREERKRKAIVMFRQGVSTMDIAARMRIEASIVLEYVRHLLDAPDLPPCADCVKNERHGLKHALIAPSTAPLTQSGVVYEEGAVLLQDGSIAQGGPIEFHLHEDGKQARYGTAQVKGSTYTVEDLVIYATTCWYDTPPAEYAVRQREPDRPPSTEEEQEHGEEKSRPVGRLEGTEQQG